MLVRAGEHVWILRGGLRSENVDVGDQGPLRRSQMGKSDR